MMMPLIGLTTYNDKNRNGFPIAALMHQYISALIESGGIPVMIPSGLTEDGCLSLLTRLDGVLLTGGGDIAIERFVGESHPRVEGVDNERDAIELFLLRTAAKLGKPFLGICRGCQMINVAFGGTLYTDIQSQFPKALKHDFDSKYQRQYLAHHIKVEKNIHLARILGETDFRVNSLHHQGIKELSPELFCSACSPDGLVEAVELIHHPFGIGIQWHPEWLLDQVVSKRLFRAFIDATGKR